MTGTKKARKPLVLHPLLLAAFPVVFVFGQNVQRVQPVELLWPLAVSVGGAGALVGLLWLGFRDLRRAGLVASAWLLLFFTFGHAADALQDIALFSGRTGEDRVLGIWMLGLALCTMALWRIGSARYELTTVLNVTGAVLVVVALVPAVAYLPGRTVDDDPELAVQADVGAAAAGEIADLPDIYYIVPDRYGGQRVMEAIFNYDNTPFLEELERRGFYVAEDARTNYPKTAHVLAGVLNLDYVHELLEPAEQRGDDWAPLFHLIRENSVARIFQDLGYRYVNIGTWWGPTARAPHADINYVYDPRSEFGMAVYDTTMMRGLSRLVGSMVGRMDTLDFLDPRRVEYRRVLFQFDKAMEARTLDGPNFVVLHLPVPHPPYLMDADGNYIDHHGERARSIRDLYTGFVEYGNRRMLELVDELLAPGDKPPPIIVIQADEGPDPQRKGDEVELYDWRTATPLELLEKFWILSAFHLPGVEDPGLYPSITPVNTFRLILDLYFGTDLGLLPDRNYIFGDERELYEFTDVTDDIPG